jgi:hypothetical protein
LTLLVRLLLLLLLAQGQWQQFMWQVLQQQGRREGQRNVHDTRI